MMRRTLALLTVVVSLLPAAAGADEVDQLIETLKPVPLDHAVWAEKLLKAAEGLKGQPEARARLYQAAYENGLKGARRAKGCPAAIRAARAMLDAGLEGKEAAAWRQELLDALKRDRAVADGKRRSEAVKVYLDEFVAQANAHAEARRFDEAEELLATAHRVAGLCARGRKTEIADKRKAVGQRKKLWGQAASLRGQLGGCPHDGVCRQKLILFYIVEVDQPGEAAKLLTADVSETLRTCVPLAARKVRQLAKEACLELGKWYESLAKGAKPRGRSNVLARARAYYERFIELETDPVRRATERPKLDRVRKQLGVDRVMKLGGKVTMKLVLIPAGEFLMGSPKDEKGRDKREGPQRKVTISKPFYMDVTEVTHKQYTAVMGRDGGQFKGPGMPMDSVLWNDAVEFCKRLSAKTRRWRVRLPTEAEWEYACRAGSETRFSFGDSADNYGDFLWYGSNSDGQPHRVAQKKPNAWGLYDMHGNVSEWCADWYASSYAKAKRRDPKGPTTGTMRVVRGGDWGHPPCRSAARRRADPKQHSGFFGFRVVVELK